MKKKLTTIYIAVLLLSTLSNALAQSEAPVVSAISSLPVASVIGVNTAGGSVAAMPLVLSTNGAVLVVKAVQGTAHGTMYLLEQASDGAFAGIEIASSTVSLAGAYTSMVVGASVLVTVVTDGVVLSAGGEALAFVPRGY